MFWRAGGFLLVSTFILFLSGCGFHLKGAIQVKQNTPSSITAASINTQYKNVSASFELEFQQLLLEQSILVKDATKADIKLVFLTENWQRQSLSVSENGLPAEYRLSYSLTYKFQKNGIVKHHEVSASRDFMSNNAQLLAVDSEQSLLKRQIQRKLAQQVIRSLPVFN